MLLFSNYQVSPGFGRPGFSCLIGLDALKSDEKSLLL